jgi:hypothetical protein
LPWPLTSFRSMANFESSPTQGGQQEDMSSI